jgi:hypothetical protein
VEQQGIVALSKLAVLAALAAVANGCGGQSATVREERAGPDPATAFADAFDGDAAGDAGRLWVAVAGRNDRRSGPLSIRVFSRGPSPRWTEAPRITERADDGARIDLAMHEGRPCFGLTRPSGRPALRCLDGSRWRPLPSPAQAATETLNEVRDVDGRMYALLRDLTHADHIVRELSGATWETVGRPIRSRGGIARLGGVVGGTVPDVTVEEVDSPPFTRTVYRLDAGLWRRAAAPLRGRALGSLTSGSVRSDDRVWVPVSEALNNGRWPFTVWSSAGRRWYPVGGRALNHTPGSAQGDLWLAGSAVWAIWQEHDLRAEGGFATSIYAQRMDTAAHGPQLVWQGESPGPGRLAVREALGKVWAVYMRERGLEVEPLE